MYHILQAIFAPNVVVELNFEGHREKLGFAHLKLIKVVHKAVRQNTTLREMLDKDINRWVINWLHGSGDHNSSRENSKKKQNRIPRKIKFKKLMLID